MPGAVLAVAWTLLAGAVPTSDAWHRPADLSRPELFACLKRGLQGQDLDPAPRPRDAFLLGSVADGRLLWWRGREYLAAQALSPGSVFKLVVAYALLDRRPELAEMVHDCRGRGRFGDGELSCWLRRGHGRVNLARALALSCNLFFAAASKRLGAEPILAAARRFGLGRSTGSDLGGEVAGSLPDRVSADELPLLATGQHSRLRVTAAQVFSLVAALANGGKLWAPMVGSARAQSTGVLENGPALDFLARALRQASLYGTGAEQRLARFRMAGKTGTAGWPATPWITHAWYAGWAPWERPEVALVVFVARGTGSHQAAGLAARVMTHYLRVRQQCLAGSGP